MEEASPRLSKHLVIAQASFHSDPVCRELLADCEKRYCFEEETDLFSSLVNFSTAKNQPYQRWVRYREGYSTSLVKELLRRSQADPEQVFIADPMMGSGSTLIAAKSMGFDTLGMDVNPYCEMIVRLKLSNPGPEELCALQLSVSHPAWEKEVLSADSIPPLSDYFPEENLVTLKKIRQWIDNQPEGFGPSALLAAWFFCLENCSNRKKDGNGLATRPAPIKNVSDFFVDTVNDIVEDFKLHPLKETSSLVKTQSALAFHSCASEYAKKLGKKLGCVIFSPPYANSFDYFESYKLELLFGGLIPPSEFGNRKKELIRNYRLNQQQAISCPIDIAEALCREIEQEIPLKEARTGKRDGRTRLVPHMIRGYFSDMDCVLKEIYETLSTGGTCYIVVDQSAYVGVIIPTDTVLALLAERSGFTVEKISICRKAATSGQQLQQYPYLKNALRESIICLKK